MSYARKKHDAVTVERVAELANVGRSTFYLHYTDKQDLLRQSLTRPSSHLATIIGRDIAPEALVHILDHFQEQRSVNRVFFSGPIRAIWVKCLAEMIEPRLVAVTRAMVAALFALQTGRDIARAQSRGATGTA